MFLYLAYDCSSNDCSSYDCSFYDCSSYDCSSYNCSSYDCSSYYDCFGKSEFSSIYFPKININVLIFSL
jgi:hypothetical protein